MRPLEVELLESAIADLAEIYWFISVENAVAATRFIRRLRERCEKIGIAPRQGRERGDLEPGLRTIGFERRVLIAYRIENDKVQITNIFYGGRDYEALYRDESPTGDLPDET